MTRHLVDSASLSVAELRHILDLSAAPPKPALSGKGVALIFEKPSNRTRHSMEMAVVQLGGHPVYTRGEEVGLEDAACNFFAVVSEKSPWLGDARVVDEQGHIPGLGDGIGDFVGLRHIKFQRLHTGQGDGGRISGGCIDFAGTPVQEFTCKGQPNATVGARHEGYGVFNLHKKLQFKNQDFVAQGKAKPGGPCLPWALLGFALIGFLGDYRTLITTLPLARPDST